MTSTFWTIVFIGCILALVFVDLDAFDLAINSWINNNWFLVAVALWMVIFFWFRFPKASTDITIENDKWSMQQATLLIIAITLIKIYDKL